MRTSWRRACCAAAVSMILPLLASAGPALAATGFEPSQVVELIKREVVAADRQASSGSQALRVEEVQIELDLVELPAKGGSRLVVPAADFGAARDEGRRAGPKRRLVVDIMPPREKRGAGDATRLAELADGTIVDAVAVPAPPASGGGALARVIGEARAGIRSAVEEAPAWEAKRVSLDLDFALERDARGAPVLVVFTAGRTPDARDLQKVKLRLAVRDR